MKKRKFQQYISYLEDVPYIDWETQVCTVLDFCSAWAAFLIDEPFHLLCSSASVAKWPEEDPIWKSVNLKVFVASRRVKTS